MALIGKTQEQVTVDATAGGVGLTDATLKTAGVVGAYCTVEDAPIRINNDGATTLTQGGAEGSPVVYPGERFNIWGQPDLISFRAIRTGGVSGKLNVLYVGSRA